MKQRQLIWLGGALVLLLAAAYLTGVFEDEISTVDVPELNIPADEVAELRAVGPDLEVALRKEGGMWRIVEPLDAAADSATVERLLGDLSAMELRTVVSTNPERYGQYGVDSTGIEVVVDWEGGSRTIVVGEAGFGSTYVRLGSDESVYQASERLRLPESLDDWRDKAVVRISSVNVAGISVEGPDRSYRVERQNGTWSIVQDGAPAPADSASTARYLGRFDPFLADGFFASEPAPHDSSYTVRLTLSGGAERTLDFVPSGDAHAVVVDGSSTVFRLRTLRLPQLVPEASYFRE